MPPINVLAEALNRELSAAPALLDLFSRRGKAIYFPSKGILGQSAEAKGTRINATIGTAFEEDGSPLALECLEETLNLPSQSFLYAPSFGMPKLRDEWAKRMTVKNPGLCGKPFSKPVVTAALTHGLSVAGYLFLDEGDEVILADLFWDNYELVLAEAYGAKLKFHNTFLRGGYDVEALRATLATGPVGKKVVLLNFPNNPTGYTVTEREAEAICRVLAESAQAGNRLVVIIDDAYFGLVYEAGIIRESLFSRLADLHPNLLAVKLDGPTKEDYVWGFRVGFITFACQGVTPAQLTALENKAAGAVRGSISNAPSISQEILLKGYTHPEYTNQKIRKFDILQKRYLKIRDLLATHPEYAQSFTALPFNSGYFMCVKPVGVEAEAVRRELLAHHGTGVIVLSGLIRLAFSSVPLDALETLFANVHTAVQSLKKT
jgi:aspartate/methionine/tyrosine aminotransferase